jgi:hypothetical protein
MSLDLVVFTINSNGSPARRRCLVVKLPPDVWFGHKVAKNPPSPPCAASSSHDLPKRESEISCHHPPSIAPAALQSDCAGGVLLEYLRLVQYPVFEGETRVVRGPVS